MRACVVVVCSRFTLLGFHSLWASAFDINLSCFISAAPVREVNAATNVHHASVVISHGRMMSMMSLLPRVSSFNGTISIWVSPLAGGGFNQVAVPTMSFMCKCVGTSRPVLLMFQWGLTVTCVLQFMLIEFILHFNCETVWKGFSERKKHASHPLVFTLIVCWRLYYFSGTVLSNGSSPGPYARIHNRRRRNCSWHPRICQERWEDHRISLFPHISCNPQCLEMEGEYYIGLFMATVRFNLWGHKGACKQINLNETLTGLWHKARLCYAYKHCERLAKEEKGDVGKQEDFIDSIILSDWWV